MDRSIVVLIILGGGLALWGLWCLFSHSSQTSADVSTYKWDFEGSCNIPSEEQATSCPLQSNPTQQALPKKRVCDGKGITPELQCQLKIMSKTPPKTASQLFSNLYRLPNLGSYYIGARVSILQNTTSYSGCQSAWGYCDDVAFLNRVIQPGLLIVGKNYRFQGKRGSILIELSEPAFISGVTLIHPLVCEIPNGYHTSAPKEFTVYGLPNAGLEDSLELGRYTYKISGTRAQTFAVKSKCLGSEMHKRVLINFEDNYGNPFYTAIYKLEVHGIFDGAVGQSKSCPECA